MGTQPTTSGASSLFWREWRQERPFLLASFVTLVLASTGGVVVHSQSKEGITSQYGSASLVIVLSIACGLILGVRAYAPDAADGTKRFVQALPIPDAAVLRTKLLVRFAAILAGALVGVGITGLSRWYPVLLGASVLLACQVGVLAGQVLERSATAFAAGLAVLVVVSRLAYPLLSAAGKAGSPYPYVLGVVWLGLSGGLVMASLWVAKQR